MNAKPKSRSSLTISCLAAQLLGHTRVANEAMTARRLSSAFPAFNAQELSNAIGELLAKDLLKQRGNESSPTYTLTDEGREGRVTVA